jgi:hypothetical protein
MGKDTRDIQLDMIMDKYLNEGKAFDKVVQFIVKNMDKSIDLLNTSINALKLHRVKQLSSKQKQLLEYQVMARDTKEQFVKLVFLIEELKLNIEEEEKEKAKEAYRI